MAFVDPEEQERYSADVHRITALVRELGGPHAVAFVEGTSEVVGEAPLDDDPDLRYAAGESELMDGDRQKIDRRATAKRPRGVVASELQEATASLLRALSTPARGLALDALPRSARIGGKFLTKRIVRSRDDG